MFDVIVAMLFDWGNRGRVHPAYGWGAAALVLFAATKGMHFESFGDGTGVMEV